MSQVASDVIITWQATRSHPYGMD